MAKKRVIVEDENMELEEVETEEAPVPMVDFAVWFVMRERRIPSNHHKEIIWADFKARGLEAKATVEDYDAALALYGIKL